MKNFDYNNISAGDLIPALTRCPTPKQLVMWADASGDNFEMHYNESYAREKGFPGIIVQGKLVAFFLTQMISRWVNNSGRLKKFKVSNHKVLLPSQDILCRGMVKEKYKKDGEKIIKLEIWAENCKQEKCVTGFAEVLYYEHVKI